MSKRNEAKEQATPRSWLFFYEVGRYECVLPLGQDLASPELSQGDGVLVCDKTGKAIGLRRIYLVRIAEQGLRVYFDRFEDFATPVELGEAVNDHPSGNDAFQEIPFARFEQILQKANVKTFKLLDEPAVTAENQRYVRDLLQDAMVSDLLGPAMGPNEEIIGLNVRDRYLVGKIAPRIPAGEDASPQPFSPPAEDTEENPTLEVYANREHQNQAESATGQNDNDEDDAIDAADNQSLEPSSLGFTFCVDASATEIELEASWGRYDRRDSETEFDEVKGRFKRCWKRLPSGGKLRLELKEGAIKRQVIDGECPLVFIQGNVSRRLSNASRLVTIFLVNDQERPKQLPDAAWLFQPELKVKATDGRGIFMHRPYDNAVGIDEEAQALNMIYRRRVEFAIGHGISVHAEVSPEDYERATEIKTVVLPEYEVPVTEVPGSNASDRAVLRGLFENGKLDMRKLADAPSEELFETLQTLIDDYQAWIGEQRDKAELPEFAKFKDASSMALMNCQEIATRLLEGLETLKHDKNALQAFRFANQVMADQRVHSMYALSQRRKENKTLDDFDKKPANHTWRPFQLAFILLSVPALANPVHRDRTQTLEAYADLLWFPTGGGKTEAYLGVAAFAMAIRRLQGELGGLDGSRGLTVIMRYTLRLLTIQQFQRATTLICAMEIQRRKKPKLWGNEPFTIGLWVGQKTTPNTTEESNDAIEREREHKFGGSGTTPAQLTFCPWCGAPIEPGREITVDTNTRRTSIYCGNPRSCEFSRSNTQGYGLPVVVVDQEIYHRPPSMLIATVDKFAMMAWEGAVRTLFGRVTQECPRHGLILPDDDKCTGTHTRKGMQGSRGFLDKTIPKNIKPIRPPDLIIQDEFHLISGPLGTMVGLYETAVDELCSWTLNGKKIRPKIVASTATVRKAEAQVNNVFLRMVNIFPPHGIDVEDNFFSVQRPIEERNGRRYLGICAPGTSRPAALIRIYVALLTGAQSLFEHFGKLADPYMTLVGYFNSLKELGGMRRLAEDDVRTRSFHVAESDALQRPGLVLRRVWNLIELTSRVSNKDIPVRLDQLEVEFKHEWLKGETRAIDIVLATNMLSVGVDVNRLGAMVVTGQPKNTSEYIQATSRVGRVFPGLICTFFSWARPRDFSHYETFEHYHSTFYKNVEAQSVTPFASRALDRGLTGALVSMMRLTSETLNPNTGAGEMKNPVDTSPDAAIAVMAKRANDMYGASKEERTKTMATVRMEKWSKEAKVPGRRLGYKPVKHGGDIVNLLEKPGAKLWEMMTVPQSMREVEPGVRLMMDSDKRVNDEPDWEPPKPSRKDGKSADMEEEQ